MGGINLSWWLIYQLWNFYVLAKRTKVLIQYSILVVYSFY